MTDDLYDRPEDYYDSIPRPLCCELQRKFPTIIANVDIYNEGDSYLVEAKWTLQPIEYIARDTQYKMGTKYFEVEKTPKFCPYCGKRLPKLVRKKNPPKNVCRVVDTGYYCDTCKERLMACTCYHPTALWEVKQSKPEEPNFIKADLVEGLTDNEFNERDKFMMDHHRCKNAEFYINLSRASGIGQAVDIMCSVCKEVKNITDYDCW
jgi:hypothetical protein